MVNESVFHRSVDPGGTGCSVGCAYSPARSSFLGGTPLVVLAQELAPSPCAELAAPCPVQGAVSQTRPQD